MKKITYLLTSFALAAAMAFAQPGPGQGPGRFGGRGTPPDPAAMIQMHVDRLATVLGLDDTQKAQAVTIFTDAQTASQTARTTVDTARQSLKNAIKENNVTNISSLAAQIGTGEGQLTASQATAEAKFYALLSTDQKTKYDSMNHGPRGGMGPGASPMGMGRPNNR